MKILVADDDTDSLTVFSDLLIESGYDVVVAANGVEALHIAQTERPDLALVDVRLPKMDGYELCRRMKQVKGLDIKIIMFTAYGDAVNVAKAKEVGADDFIAKTDDFANMHRAMKKLLGGE